MVNFLFAPLKIWFFAVTLPVLIRGKLRRLRHPQRAIGSFPFRTPMRDSAADYLAARHAHLPIARFLLHRQCCDAGATVEQPTPPPSARVADFIAVTRCKAGTSLPPSAAPPSAPILEELLHLGDTHRDGGDHDGERSAESTRGRIRARSDRLRRRTCITTLALVALSLVLFMPATLQGVIVEEAIVVLVSFVMVAALMATSIARLFAAAWGELVHTHGTAALIAPLAAAAATAVAGIIVRARHAHRRAEKTAARRRV